MISKIFLAIPENRNLGDLIKNKFYCNIYRNLWRICTIEMYDVTLYQNEKKTVTIYLYTEKIQI